jgi:hypothetical protein
VFNPENSNEADAKKARGQRAGASASVPESPNGDAAMAKAAPVSGQREKLTAAEIICRIEAAFADAEGSKEAAMSALVAIYHTGDAKTDAVVRGFARDTMLLWKERQKRTGSSEQDA